MLSPSQGNNAKASQEYTAMKTTKTTKATVDAFVGPVMPTAPVAPVVAAEVPATTLQAAPVAHGAVVYTITAKAKVIAPHLTLQRGCTVPVGAQWRNNGHKATNTRAIVIETLASLGATFTRDQAVAVLKPLKDAAILGSGTPASYLAAFVKSGYLSQEVA